MRSVFTLSNLPEALDATKPARLAVIGYPVAHSASPRLHQPALDALGIDASYIRLEVKPGEVAEAFSAMRAAGFIGCNVTVPHKFEAMSCCAEVSPQAKTLGAVNTIVFSENGNIGHNTDGPGFIRAIEDAFGIDMHRAHTLILGAGGGAGQAIATQCCLQKPAKLTLVNRSVAKIEELAARIQPLSPDTEIFTVSIEDDALETFCHQADLLVQTTSLGLKADDSPVIPDSYFLPHHCAYDTIYQPPETPFLRSAKAKGCRTDNGMSLLLQQGALSFQHWFPGTDPLSHMRAASSGVPNKR
jgi:shikimate dehydrogenase